MGQGAWPGFPIDATGPPTHSGPLPGRVDVAVVGGGIAGVMCAWSLVARGFRVFLAEKGRIAAEQSGRNWGWIRQQGRDPVELPLMIEANRIWGGLEAEAGAELGFERSGVLYLANDSADIARFEAWLPHARTHGLDTRMLTRAEVRAMLPAASRDWAGGILTPSDARAEPWIAVPRLARALAARGAILREDCAVRALDVAAGRVAGVVTEAGRVGCDAVVLAGGAWSSLFARRHGLHLPQLAVRSTIMATPPLPSVFEGNASDGRIGFRRRRDGGYSLAAADVQEHFIGPDSFRSLRSYMPYLMAEPFATRLLGPAPRGYPDAWGTPRDWPEDSVSPFERCRILSPAPRRAVIDRVRRRFAETFPMLGNPGIVAAWAGMIDTMPDFVPVLDHAGTLPGLVIATGLSGHGFGIGPAFGRAAAALATGDDPGQDLTAFRLARFAPGQPIRRSGAL